MNIASQEEVEALRRRIDRLEKAVNTLASLVAAANPKTVKALAKAQALVGK